MLQYLMKGGKPLSGEVTIGGAKNAALGILAAAIMTDEPVTLENLPDVSDINVMLKAIGDIGAEVERLDRHTVRITAGTITTQQVLFDYVRNIRASYYLIGALLGKYKLANVALPGGCAIGARPIDQHLKGFHALGAVTEITEQGSLLAKADKLTGIEIFMDVVSVGATINVMLAAVFAEGRTVIRSAAKEPHVVDVANLLNCMGADIKGAGTDRIRINGVEKLHGTSYSIVPDQIEAGTFMTAAAASGGNILIKNVIPKHLDVISDKLSEIGCTIEKYDDSVRVIGSNPKNYANVKTRPYPGFPTDMQPQIATVLALSKGESVVTESIFENRFAYVEDLNRMGAKIKVGERGDKAFITGVSRLHGASVMAHDLRAGAALVIAGLSADGYTLISDIKYILRGYEDFDEKMRNLGGQIVMIDSDREAEIFFQATGGSRYHLEHVMVDDHEDVVNIVEESPEPEVASEDIASEDIVSEEVIEPVLNLEIVTE